MHSTGTPEGTSSDYTLGYRPQLNKRPNKGSVPPPEQRQSLVDTPEIPPASKPPRSKGRKAANLFICLGFLVILAFSLVALFFGGAGSAAMESLVADPASNNTAPASDGAQTGAITTAPTAEAETAVGTRLKLETIHQKPELPNGCEVTSLTTILHYWGYKIDKMDFAKKYLPREDYWFDENGMRHGPDPVDAYPGAPWVDGFGFYCYAGVVEEGANKYLAKKGGDHVAKNLTGAKAEDLYALLDEGIPTMVWHTTDGKEPLRSTETGWYLYDTDELFTPYVNMHVMVLTGYDEEYCYFSDPLGHYKKRKRSAFEKTYELTGSRALAVFEVKPES